MSVMQEENKIKDIEAALKRRFREAKEPPERADVEKAAQQAAILYDYQGDVSRIVEMVLIAIDTRMEAGVSIVDPEAMHDEEWVKRLEKDSVYTKSYRNHLVENSGWTQRLAYSLEDECRRILGHLQDPLSEGDWNRRGLVIGHVQSGKTANYLGLVSQAADAGYKLIIIIAGIHNNLRKQTQERVEEGFVGRSTALYGDKIVGVGKLAADDGWVYPGPATLTTVDEDFNKSNLKIGAAINDWKKPVVLVIKKNVKTLEALHQWLDDYNSRGKGRITDIPMLLIDDEADNASINTNKPDLDPTRTNALIRKILALFGKSCYIGYTATPFANIFINPEAYGSEKLREELFPKDFIYSLKAPSTYFGPEKVFGEDSIHTQIIGDAEDYIPLIHKGNHQILDLPPSLYRAIHQFVLTRAIRNLRGDKNRHCSMMVNVSRFVAVQKDVCDHIRAHIRNLGNGVKANYAMPEKISEKNRFIAALKDVFIQDFSDVEFSWETIRKNALAEVVDDLNVCLINSRSDEVLDYGKYEKNGQGLTVIAVGGLSLSRGLTLEGLTISYMYRNTRMYDTLMQMGRWFGYRPGYEDLCRVHLTAESESWYGHISEASEELRQQITTMRKANLSPKEFGLYVLAHPNRLLITAANKMQHGERRCEKQNFSGRLIESYKLLNDDAINSDNEKLISEHWESEFGKKLVETDKGWFVSDVPVEGISRFLHSFKVHPAFSDQKAAVRSFLLQIAELYRFGDVLFISVKKKNAANTISPLGAQSRGIGGRGSLYDKGSGTWTTSKNRVASKGDEKLGLSKKQQEAAAESAGDAKGGVSDFHYRKIRNKPLLMIHVLELEDDVDTKQRVPAFGISFPDGHYGREHEVDMVVNPIWIKQHDSIADNPDDEEDYD